MSILKALAGVLLATTSSLWANSITYTIKVDTSSSGIASQTGSLDFKFNPGPDVVAPAELDIMNFDAGGGTLDLTPAVLLRYGSVSGDLPGTVVLYNDAPAPNEYGPGFTYGNSIAFQVRLIWTQPDPAPTSSSIFYFTMYDGLYRPLLTSVEEDPYQAAELRLNADGSTSALSYSPQVTISSDSDVPEPRTVLLMAAGLALGVWLKFER